MALRRGKVKPRGCTHNDSSQPPSPSWRLPPQIMLQHGSSTPALLFLWPALLWQITPLSLACAGLEIPGFYHLKLDQPGHKRTGAAAKELGYARG